MRYSTIAQIEATERIRIKGRSDLGATIVRIGDYKYAANEDKFYIDGTPEERADFLRRLAVGASAAADEIEADRPVEAVAR